MGLSYLHKKNWHPSNMDNVRQVWEAEHAVSEVQRKEQEHLKRLKEERSIEDLKRIQISQGLIPESSLNKIEWMYQDRAAFNKSEATAEEYLLGKAVTDQQLETKAKQVFATSENEAFLRLKEDPLVQIKMMEMEQRRQVMANPMTLKKIREEIELLKRGGKKDKKQKSERSRRDRSRSSDRHKLRDRDEESDRHDRKHRRHDTHRSDRHDSREQGRRDSRERRHERSDRHDSRDRDERRHQRSDRHESRDNKLERPDKEASRKESLGPDMSLYRDKLKQIQEQEALRRKQAPNTAKTLTQAEKQQLADEMQQNAKQLQDDRKHSAQYKEATEQVSSGGAYLRNVKQQAFMDTSQNLEKRLNSKQHYRLR